MSSNFTVKRICEHCQGIFNAKTTVTRFCGRLCNRRSYKFKERNNFMKDVDQQVVNILTKPIQQLQIMEFLNVRQTAKLLGISETMVYNMINGGKLCAVNLSIRKTIIRRNEIDRLFENDKSTVLKQGGSSSVKIKDCYHIAQAQSKFNISEAGLYNLMKRHKLAKFKKGRFTYINKSDLDYIFMPKLNPCQK